MNVLITGASGFIGSHLIKFFQERYINVIALTRDKRKFKNNHLKVIEELEDISKDDSIDAIINLAGAPIDRHWSDSYKKILLNSRIDVTQELYKLVARLHVKPKTVISASAVGYYGSRSGDNILNENSEHNSEFTHTLCNQWEKEALKIETLGCSVFIIRLGVVLGKNGGLLKKVLPLFKVGLGGKIGSGKQYISWVHMHDVLQAVLFLLESTNNSTSIYNLTSPSPVTNLAWTAVIADTLNRPTFNLRHIR